MRRLKPVRTRVGHDPHAARRAQLKQLVPYVAANRTPDVPETGTSSPEVFHVATYNVHRWTGLTGGRKWQPERAHDVIAELDVDVLALQEVLLPFEAEDPLERLVNDLGFHLVFVSTRVHRLGELGNAVLSRWPIRDVFTIDLSFSRLEQRSAIASVIDSADGGFGVVSTHLALVDRTRHRQVHSLLEHPHLQGPTVLLGDMNAWRRCRATRRLEREFTELHHNRDWPPSFPATRPVLALDRIYARRARVVGLHTHDTPVARRASDHLPVVATVHLNGSS